MDYNQHIAHHVQKIPRSGIRDFFDIVQSMKDVISLGIGEPDFQTPWNIREAAIYSLERGRTSYTSNLGLLELRKSISVYLDKYFEISYDPASEILVTVGVSEAIDLALRALVNPGDEVLYHEPCYVSYSPSIQLAYGIPVPVATKAEDAFQLKAEELEKKITPKSKILILNYPNNPTGATQPAEELKKIAALCSKHNLIVLTDEIYSELTYDEKNHASISSLPGMKERTIFLHGFSKAFAMTGLRIGYACAPKPFIEAMMKIHQYSILCAPITTQDAAIEALQSGPKAFIPMRTEYQRRRDYFVKELQRIGLDCFFPTGAFYAFPSITKTGLSSRDFAVNLLNSQKVAVVPGTAFGSCGEGFIRCSYATGMEELKKAVQHIKTFCDQL